MEPPARTPNAAPAQDGRSLASLARKDRRAAEAALGELTLEQQVAAVCEAPLAQRGRLLELVPEPADVIPRLPVAELCFTAKALGSNDASWLLEYATSDQLTAVFDLDGWRGIDPDLVAIDGWFGALAEAGDAPLLRTSQAIDAELLVLWLRERVIVHMKPPNDDDSWEAPIGGHTLDGQFYLVALDPKDDLASLLRLLQTLFQGDYWLYFRLLQGTIWELGSDLEEWARRWRTGRLEDLGFPAWDEAMRIYGFVRPDERARLSEAPDELRYDEWNLPVWITQLPGASDPRHSIFRAASELDADERGAFFYGFLGLANKVAVADRMPLGDAETLPRALVKAAAVSSAGLDHIVGDRELAESEVLRRASLERLYRVGASLDPSGTRPPPLEAEDEAEEEAETGEGEGEA